ncbi:SseB family protein [Phytohabitans aurantiacus]|uniref:SseB family protein n=1 Tax=Phytohabitans aurantiacus TaxID=3016789 RepID=UPI002492FBAC|nr:SseB family protein [Phytohabitans aurantiacus]
MTEWEPATEAEVAMRDALRASDQEQYFRILSRTELFLPVSAESLAGRAPMGWGTWTTSGRTHVLAFTSSVALQACLASNAGSARRIAYHDLAAAWPNLEWWLAVNPGLPIEGYLPAWFVTQLARGDVRLPGRTIGARARLDRADTAARARATATVPGSLLAPGPGGSASASGLLPPAAGLGAVPAARESAVAAATQPAWDTHDPALPAAHQPATWDAAPAAVPAASQPPTWDAAPPPTASVPGQAAAWDATGGAVPAARAEVWDATPAADPAAAQPAATPVVDERPAEPVIGPGGLPRRVPTPPPPPGVPPSPMAQRSPNAAPAGLAGAGAAGLASRAAVASSSATPPDAGASPPPGAPAGFGARSGRLGGGLGAPHAADAHGPGGAGGDTTAPAAPPSGASATTLDQAAGSARATDTGFAGGGPATSASGSGTFAAPATDWATGVAQSGGTGPARSTDGPADWATGPGPGGAGLAAGGAGSDGGAGGAASAGTPADWATGAGFASGAGFAAGGNAAANAGAPADWAAGAGFASGGNAATSADAPAARATGAETDTGASGGWSTSGGWPEERGAAQTGGFGTASGTGPISAAAARRGNESWGAPVVPGRTTASGPTVAAPVPVENFTPVNEVEKNLLAAAGDGSTDSFLSTLLLAKVLLPVSPVSADGTRPGEPGFAWLTETLDGEPYIVVFTSMERLRDHLGDTIETIDVKFVQLIGAWPDPAWSFAVNPNTPVGAKLPGAQIVALASWADEVGLGAEAEEEPKPQAAPAARPTQAAVVHDPALPTMMQKTISPAQVDYYLDRGYDRVSGFVHRAGEVAHLTTPAVLHAALGLGYAGSPFKPDADETYVLRWPAHRPSLYRIPYGGQNEAAMRAMEGWVIERPPFRGNGFAPSDSGDVIAEFKVDSARLPHGAQLWRIGADGNEKLIALLDSDAPTWRRVGEQ